MCFTIIDEDSVSAVGLLHLKKAHGRQSKNPVIPDIMQP